MNPYNVLVRPIVYMYSYALRMYYRRNSLRRILKPMCFLIVCFLVFVSYRRHRQQSLLWYDRIYESLGSERLNIGVVEEHHEALPYWFAASYKGLLPTHDNILIHIDGHSDLAVAAYDPAISKFKSPESGAQIQLLMQRNDVFITAAAYKDLISTIIWIYPDWLDTTDFGEKAMAGGLINLTLGFYDVYYDGSLISGFCACYQAGDDDDSCDFTDAAGGLLKDFNGQCNTYKVISLYQVKASLAIERLPELLDTLASSSILLDIDEDFYGVMRGSDLLADINFTLLDQLNDLLASTFTVLSVIDEAHAHSLLENILHMIKANCPSTGTEGNECSRENFRKIQRFLTESGQERVRIGGRTMKSDQLQKIVEFVSTKFTKQNIDQLLQTGFCLKISPLTYKLDIPEEAWHISYERIAVCHGINVPESDNQIHMPTTDELETTTDTLLAILDVLPTNNVNLVTIARSNRDGFTPRNFQPKIEEAVLMSLRQKFIDSDIIYDRNLMLHLGQGISSVT